MRFVSALTASVTSVGQSDPCAQLHPVPLLGTSQTASAAPIGRIYDAHRKLQIAAAQQCPGPSFCRVPSAVHQGLEPAAWQ